MMTKRARLGKPRIQLPAHSRRGILAVVVINQAHLVHLGISVIFAAEGKCTPFLSCACMYSVTGLATPAKFDFLDRLFLGAY